MNASQDSVLTNLWEKRYPQIPGFFTESEKLNVLFVDGFIPLTLVHLADESHGARTAGRLRYVRLI